MNGRFAIDDRSRDRAQRRHSGAKASSVGTSLWFRLICGHNLPKGWRANASYFYIVKEFVRDNIDMDILEELLSLGELGVQYCIKSELAYSKLREVEGSLQTVSYAEFNEKYNQRDITARQKMRQLVDSDANKVTKVFSTLFEE